MTDVTDGAADSRLARVLPIVGWLPAYRRGDLTADLRAGATVGVLLVPQAMAYAALAGVPPIAGLYAAMVSLVVYALFGSSRFISVGPVAIDSLLTAAAVAPLADGDTGRYVMLTAILTVMVGLLQVAAGLAKMGALVNLVSVPVISGFTSAAAVTIALTQVADLFGLDQQGRSSTFVDAVGDLASAVTTIDPVTTVIGLGSLLGLLAVNRWAPHVPGPLLLVGLATAVVALGDLAVEQIGEIPSGLPAPQLPDGSWSDVTTLLPSAATIALISYMESISTGSVFARRTRTKVRPDQELLAVGLANGAAGVMQGLPVAGGFSRGAVNFDAGARTPLSGVVAAVLVVVSLMFLTPLLALVPTAVLAAVILAAIGSLIDLKGALAVARVRRGDLLALLLTVIVTLGFGPTWGLGVGVGLSIALHLRQLNRPHLPELGYVPDHETFLNVRRHETVTHPDVVAVRIDAPLSFMSARAIVEDLADRMRRRPDAHHLVIDATAITDADFTGAEMVGDLIEDLATTGVAVWIGGLRGPVRDVLGRTDWYPALEAAGRVRGTVVEVACALPLEPETRPPTWPAR